jgi:hypothetical protein
MNIKAHAFLLGYMSKEANQTYVEDPDSVRRALVSLGGVYGGLAGGAGGALLGATGGAIKEGLEESEDKETSKAKIKRYLSSMLIGGGLGGAVGGTVGTLAGRSTGNAFGEDFAEEFRQRNSATDRGMTENFVKALKGKEGADDESSPIGRWLGLTALEGKGIIDNPVKTSALQAPGLAVRAAGLAPLNLPLDIGAGAVANRLNIPEGEEGEEYIKDKFTEADEARGKFGKSFSTGAKKAKILAAIMTVLGGAGGAAAGYFGAREGLVDADPEMLALAAGVGGAAGGGLGTLAGHGASNALYDTILTRLSPETRKRLTEYLPENRAKTALPGGSIYGAYKTRDAEQESKD